MRGHLQKSPVWRAPGPAGVGVSDWRGGCETDDPVVAGQLYSQNETGKTRRWQKDGVLCCCDVICFLLRMARTPIMTWLLTLQFGVLRAEQCRIWLTASDWNDENHISHRLTHRFIDWLIDLFIYHLSTYKLFIDWLMDGWMDGLIDWLIYWLKVTGRTTICSNFRSKRDSKA